MNLAEITCEVFMCDLNEQDAQAVTPDFMFESLYDDLSKKKLSPVVDLGRGYTLASISSGDIVLLSDEQPVGFYIGEALNIQDAHKGRKLSVPLILEAVKYRPVPTERKFSLAGFRSLTFAWDVANGKRQNPWLPI